MVIEYESVTSQPVIEMETGSKQFQAAWGCLFQPEDNVYSIAVFVQKFALNTPLMCNNQRCCISWFFFSPEFGISKESEKSSGKMTIENSWISDPKLDDIPYCFEETYHTDIIPKTRKPRVPLNPCRGIAPTPAVGWHVCNVQTTHLNSSGCIKPPWSIFE